MWIVSKPRPWTIRALCRSGRCRGTVLIGAYRPLQEAVRRVRQLLGQRHQIGPGIDAEEEADVAGIVPAVEVRGLGEVGVAPQQKRAEAGPPAEEDRPGR